MKRRMTRKAPPAEYFIGEDSHETVAGASTCAEEGRSQRRRWADEDDYEDDEFWAWFGTSEPAPRVSDASQRERERERERESEKRLTDRHPVPRPIICHHRIGSVGGNLVGPPRLSDATRAADRGIAMVAPVPSTKKSSRGAAPQRRSPWPATTQIPDRSPRVPRQPLQLC